MKSICGCTVMFLLFTLLGCATPPTPSQPTHDALRQMLNGDDAAMRADAIAQLQQDGSPEAVTVLGEFFLGTRGVGRLQAARALLAINTPQAQDYVRTAMADKPLTARRQVAMQALEMGGETTYPFVRQLLRDENMVVRMNTVQLVQFFNPTLARSLLHLALDDESPSVQQAAMDALRGLEDAPMSAR